MDQLLHMAGLDDSRLKLKIAWTNVLACRPCDYIGGPNRIPTCHEISMCRERLATTLAIFNPKVVVLLGKTAQQNWEATRDYGNFVWSGKVVALPHPARLLRAGGLASPDVQDYVTELKTLPRLIKEES